MRRNIRKMSNDWYTTPMNLKIEYSKEEIEKALERKRQLLKAPENSTNHALENMTHRMDTGKFIGDFVYGANDGIITTFAVVTGAVGASLSPLVIIILGFANLFADGFSMGASSFLSKRSNNDYQKGQRLKEEWEIKHFPELEVTEVRTIYEKQGFTGDQLDKAVAMTIKDKKKWVDIMMIHELGILEDYDDKPWEHGLATFGAFVIAGLMPLLPFLLPFFTKNTLLYSPLFAGVALFTAGALQTLITPKTWWKGGIEMLLVGGAAGTVSFLVGYLLKQVFGIVG